MREIYCGECRENFAGDKETKTIPVSFVVALSKSSLWF